MPGIRKLQREEILQDFPEDSCDVPSGQENVSSVAVPSVPNALDGRESDGTDQVLAKTRPSAYLTALRSAIDKVPSLRNTSASSRVKSLKRTLHGTARPASCQPWIATSLGQSDLAEVIIARIDC